jgi:CheY-like chemotaxis protein
MMFPDLSHASVVVVDDMAFGRTLVRSLLSAASVRKVEVAQSVTEGWSLIHRMRPDLLILDWQLAGPPGLELLRMVRHAPDSPNPYLAVLMLTAYREEGRVREAVQAGITSYLTKPFSPNDFLTKVKFCVEDRRPFARSSERFGPALEGPAPSNIHELE